MARLEDLTRGATVKGILSDRLVTIVDVKWYGSTVVELTYKDASGRLANELLIAVQTFRDGLIWFLVNQPVRGAKSRHGS